MNLERKLGVNKEDKVLEVGSGHDPYARSDVLCDKHVEDDTERNGELRTDGRPFHQADIEDSPFGTIFENGGLKDQSIFLKLFLFQYRDLFTISKIWNQDLDCEVVEYDSDYRKYFEQPYNIEKLKELDGFEIQATISSLEFAIRSRLKTKIMNRIYKLV